MPYNAFISYSHTGDEHLAEAVQHALHQFARPWFKLRMLHVFRDKTNLSASPALWHSIEEALGDSEYFLLMACPQSAESRWVQREVDWWLANRSVDRLFILLSGGDLVWDVAMGDFDSKRTTSLPSALFGRFSSEPLWVDFRSMHDSSSMGLRHTGFRSAILSIAAPIHGRPKDELDGVDVQRNRRFRRIVRLVIAALFILTITSAFAAWRAIQNAAVARQQRALADTRRLEAERATEKERAARLRETEARNAADEQRKNAETQKQIAETQRDIATRNAAIADARRLTAEAELIISREPGRMGVGALLAADAVTRLRTLNLESSDASETLTSAMFFLLPIEQRQTFRSSGWGTSRHRAVFAEGGLHFAVSDGSPTVQILDPKVGGFRTVVLNGRVSYLTFSAGGRYLLTATGLNDTSHPTLWDLSRDVPAKIFEQPVTFGEAALAPDGQRIMLSSRSDAAVWDTATGSPVCFLPDGSHVQAALFSPDAKYLAVSYWSPLAGNSASSLSLFAAGTCGRLQTMISERPADFLAFSPDSHYLAAASGSRPEVSVWDAGTGRLLATGSHAGGNGLDNIRFSPRGSFLASAGYDSMVRLWRPPHSGVEVGRIPGNGLLPYQVDFSPDEKYALTVFVGDNVVRVWRTDTLREVARLPHGAPVLKAAFRSDSSGLMTASSDGLLRTWAMPGEGVQEHELAADLQGISSSADGRFLATLDSAGTSDRSPVLKIWDFARGTEVFRAELPPGAHEQAGVSSTSTRAVAVSRDGQRAAAVGYWGAGHSVYVWDTQSQTPMFQADHSARVESLVLSPDGLYLATVSKSEGMLWDIRQRRSSVLGASLVRRMDFSGDSKHIAIIEETAGAESCVKGATTTGHQLHVLKLARGTSAVAIANRGKFIAAADGRRIRVWDTVTCRVSNIFDEKERITALAFDDTGSLLAASTSQGNAEIRKVPAGDRVYRVHHEGYLANVSFSTLQNQHYLVTSNGYLTRGQGEHAPNPTNTARLWNWKAEDIVAGACRVLVSYDSREFPQDPDFDASMRKVCAAGH